MGVAIINATLSKNPVKTKEVFKISVELKETIDAPKAYRLRFELGKPKGILRNIKRKEVK